MGKEKLISLFHTYCSLRDTTFSLRTWGCLLASTITFFGGRGLVFCLFWFVHNRYIKFKLVLKVSPDSEFKTLSCQAKLWMDIELLKSWKYLLPQKNLSIILSLRYMTFSMEIIYYCQRECEITNFSLKHVLCKCFLEIHESKLIMFSLVKSSFHFMYSFHPWENT